MRTLLLLIPLFIFAGCQGSSDPGIPPEASDSMAKVGAAAKASGGDWDKLTEDQKKAVLARTGGDEAAARAMLKQIAGGAGSRGPK